MPYTIIVAATAADPCSHAVLCSCLQEAAMGEYHPAGTAVCPLLLSTTISQNKL